MGGLVGDANNFTHGHVPPLQREEYACRRLRMFLRPDHVCGHAQQQPYRDHERRVRGLRQQHVSPPLISLLSGGKLVGLPI
jgi:hypothetical protein